MEIIYASDNSWRDVPDGPVRAMLVTYDATKYAGTPYIEIREKRNKELVVQGLLTVLVLANTRDIWINGCGYSVVNQHYYYVDFQNDTYVRKGQYEWRVFIPSKYLDNGYNSYGFITGSTYGKHKLQPMFQIDPAAKTRKLTFDVKDVKKIRFSSTANINEVIIKTRREFYRYTLEAITFSTLSATGGEILKDIDNGSVEINYTGDPFQYRVLVIGEYSNLKQTI